MSILTSFKELGNKLNPKNLYEKKSRSVAGIDIGSSSIKIVQLKKEKEKAVLETYGELMLGRYANIDLGQAARLTDEKITEAVSDLKKEAGVKAEKAFVSIPLKYSFLTTISLPLMSKTEIEKAVPFEIKRYIPVPLSEVVFDWQLLPSRDENEDKKTPKTNILLVAIYKDFVNKYQNIAKQAGFSETGFEIEIFSGARSAIYNEPRPVLIIDLGASKAKMAIIERGFFKSAHEFDKGCQDLTMSLSRSLGIDFEKAEEMKKEIGLSSRPEHKGITEIFEPILSYIFFEAGRLSAEFRRKEGRAVNKAYLMGGGALLKGIDNFAINKLGIEVEIGDPFMKIEYPAFLENVLKAAGPVFANSAGLALTGI